MSTIEVVRKLVTGIYTSVEISQYISMRKNHGSAYELPLLTGVRLGMILRASGVITEAARYSTGISLFTSKIHVAK